MRCSSRVGKIFLFMCAFSVALPVAIGQIPGPLYQEVHFSGGIAGWDVALHQDEMLVALPGARAVELFSYDVGGLAWQSQLRLACGCLWYAGAVAISENTLVIGSYSTDRGGAAYVFNRTSSSSVDAVPLKLTGTGSTPRESFGASLALLGETLAVGAYNRDGIGGVYVYRPSGGEWRESQVIAPPDGQPLDFFGWSIGMTSEWLIVGAVGAGEGQQGAVYAYRNEAGQWNLSQRLDLPLGERDDNFGYSVAIQGDRLVVGSPGRNAGGPLSGAAYVYELEEGAWTLDSALISFRTGEGDSFGSDVAVHGGRIVVGAVHAFFTVPEHTIHGRHGAAYLFDKSADGWTEGAPFLRGPTHSGFPQDGWRSHYGHSVVLNENHALISAPKPGGKQDGSVFSYSQWRS